LIAHITADGLGRNLILHVDSRHLETLAHSHRVIAIRTMSIYSATRPRPNPPPNLGLSPPSSRLRYSPSPPSRRGGLYAPPSSLRRSPAGGPSRWGLGAFRCVAGTISGGI